MGISIWGSITIISTVFLMILKSWGQIHWTSLDYWTPLTVWHHWTLGPWPFHLLCFHSVVHKSPTPCLVWFVFTHSVSLAKPQTVSQDSEWTEWTEWTECGVGSSFPLCATCSSVAQQSRLSQLLRRKLAVLPTRWRNTMPNTVWCMEHT